MDKSLYPKIENALKTDMKYTVRRFNIYSNPQGETYLDLKVSEIFEGSVNSHGIPRQFFDPSRRGQGANILKKAEVPKKWEVFRGILDINKRLE